MKRPFLKAGTFGAKVWRPAAKDDAVDTEEEKGEDEEGRTTRTRRRRRRSRTRRQGLGGKEVGLHG